MVGSRVVGAGAITLATLLGVESVGSRLNAQATQPSQTAVAVAESAKKATVVISALDERGRVLGAGSGFIVRPDGLVVTNFHVIQRASALRITMSDGEVYDNVFYVTSDPRRDLAVLKIPVSGAASLALETGAGIPIGGRVYAMGNPLGQTYTFSDGLVSAVRTMEGVTMLQITAPISPGSSGGPVMNEAGAVVGVATMMMTTGQNLNYAVPVRYLQPLLSTGEPPRRFSAALLPGAVGGLASIDAPTGNRAPSPSGAGLNQYEAQVALQLITLANPFLSSGWTHVETESGRARQGASVELSLSLRAGREYIFLAACDNDCRDVDLVLRDGYGRALASEVSRSDTPRLSFVPIVSGEYALEVSMYHCANAPCTWGMSMLAR